MGRRKRCGGFVEMEEDKRGERLDFPGAEITVYMEFSQGERTLSDILFSYLSAEFFDGLSGEERL